MIAATKHRHWDDIERHLAKLDALNGNISVACFLAEELDATGFIVRADGAWLLLSVSPEWFAQLLDAAQESQAEREGN